MSLSNKVVNIYSDYIIQPNTFYSYIIPAGATAAGAGSNNTIDIILPKIYNNSLEVASFRITNNSTYNAVIKYIANDTDNAAANLSISNGDGIFISNITILVTITGGKNAYVVIDNVNQSYVIIDFSAALDNSNTGIYLPLTGGTLTGSLTVNAALNVGSNILANNSTGQLSSGKMYINGVSGGLPSTAICD